VSRILARQSGAWRLLSQTPTVDPTPGAVIYGSNVGNPSGAPNSDPATRIAQFGRIPMSRVYYSTLPAAIDSKITDNSPEKRCQASFKGFQPSQVVAGAADSVITSFAGSVPGDTTVFLTYWHEPNSELNAVQFTATEYKNAWIRIAGLLWSLPSRNRVIPMVNYSAPNGWGAAAWDDSWLVHYGDLGNDNAIISWDAYGNPHASGGLTGLDTPYPSVGSTLDLMYAKTQLGGYEANGRWGITEINSPRRNFDPSESQRATWFQDVVDYLTSRPTSPHHVLLWEGDGVQWDQNFYTTLMRDTWKTITLTSA
jgi:hypothetical protein